MESTAFAGFPEAVIDPSGTFKYIQIQLTSKIDGSKQILVRGFEAQEFHKGIYKQFQEKELKPSGLTSNYEIKCLGGGRIKHTPETKTLFIYGYSKTYEPKKKLASH